MTCSLMIFSVCSYNIYPGPAWVVENERKFSCTEDGFGAYSESGVNNLFHINQ